MRRNTSGLTNKDWMDAIIANPEELYSRRAYAEWLRSYGGDDEIQLGMLIDTMLEMEALIPCDKCASAATRPWHFYGSETSLNKGFVSANHQSLGWEDALDFRAGGMPPKAYNQNLAASSNGSIWSVPQSLTGAQFKWEGQNVQNVDVVASSGKAGEWAKKSSLATRLLVENVYHWFPKLMRECIAHSSQKIRICYEPSNRIVAQHRGACDLGVWWRNGLPYRLDCSRTQWIDLARYGVHKAWPIEELYLSNWQSSLKSAYIVEWLPKPCALRKVYLVDVAHGTSAFADRLVGILEHDFDQQGHKVAVYARAV